MVQTRFAEWLLEKMQTSRPSLTPAELARAARVPQSSLSAYLNGHTVPNMETASKIAACFGVPLEEIIHLTRPDSDVVPASEDVIIPEIRKRLAKMTADEQRDFALEAIVLAERLLRRARKQAESPPPTLRVAAEHPEPYDSGPPARTPRHPQP